MNKDYYTTLIYKKLKGDISLEEQSALDLWLGQAKENEQWAKQLEEDWEISSQYNPSVDFEIDVAADFKRLQERIRLEERLVSSPQDNVRVAHQAIGKVVQMSHKKRNNRWLAWTSAAVIALAVGFWFTNTQNQGTANQLTLATQFQEKKAVELPDGTKVWLNGNSELNYPATFAGQTRTVQLKGEAFFEVKRDEQKPFIIETNKTNVTVLGTSFNVRAHIAESQTVVVVATGKVQVENKAGNKNVTLIANEKGIYDATKNTVEKVTEKDMNELAWHTDKLIFKNTPLTEVLATLEQQFEVTINLLNPVIETCEWNGLYKVQVGVKSILDELAKDLDMTLEPKGNTTFELSGGSCKQ